MEVRHKQKLEHDISPLLGFSNRFLDDHTASNSENLIASPLSVHFALSMAMMGAGPRLLPEMLKALLIDDESEWYKTITMLFRELDVDMAHAFFVDGSLKVSDVYIKLLDAVFDTQPSLADFKLNAERERNRINKFVSNATHEKIPTILPPGSVNSLTASVLISAVYFKAKWDIRFDPKRTKEEIFHAKSEVKWPMMKLENPKNKIAFGETATYKAIRLKYRGSDMAMVCVLSQNPEENLDIDVVAWTQLPKLTKVTRVWLPKLKIEWNADLTAYVSQFMPSAFGNDADFSRLAPEGDIYISSVVHKAMIEMDEEGTTAAAATAVVLRSKSKAIRQETKEFIANRPFYVMLVHMPTSTPVFVGKVNNPIL